MSIIACPYCHAPMTVTPELAGSGVVRCPRCGNLLSVAPPALPASPGPAPAEGEQAPAPPPPRRAKRARADAEREEPSEDKSAPRAGSWATFGCCLLLIFSCGGGCIGWMQYRQRALDDIAAADRSYAEGKKAEAVAVYKDRFSHVADDRRPEIIKRIADHEATAGDKAEARRWVEKGLDGKMEIAYDTAGARDLLAQVKRERAEAEAKRQAEVERKQAEAAKRKAEDEERRKGLQVSADELHQEYAGDRKAADAKYKGKTLRVTGTLREHIASEPGTPGGNHPILWVQTSGEPWLWCHFPRGTDAQVRGLRPGERVTVRGTCDGNFVGEIRLTGCSLEP